MMREKTQHRALCSLATIMLLSGVAVPDSESWINSPVPQPVLSQNGTEYGATQTEALQDVEESEVDTTDATLLESEEGQREEPSMDLSVDNRSPEDLEALLERELRELAGDQKKVRKVEESTPVKSLKKKPQATTRPDPWTIPTGPANQSVSWLTLSPQNLDFGTVKIHEAKELSFTITNTSSKTVTGGINAPDPLRVVSGDIFTLAPGATHIVTLCFHPTESGLYLANVTVRSSEGTRSVHLEGTAKRLSGPAALAQVQ